MHCPVLLHNSDGFSLKGKKYLIITMDSRCSVMKKGLSTGLTIELQTKLIISDTQDMNVGSLLAEFVVVVIDPFFVVEIFFLEN